MEGQPSPVVMLLIMSKNQELQKRYQHILDDAFERIRCDDGWHDILAYLFAEWERKQLPPITQIKEKFGLLRIYFTDRLNSTARELACHAEERSASTCEGCGRNDASLRPIPGNLQTLCEECAQKHCRC